MMEFPSQKQSIVINASIRKSNYIDVPSHWAKEHLFQNHLDFYGYTEQQILHAMRELLKEDVEDWTPKQKEGLEMFNSQGSWSFSDPENHQELKKWFTIFDCIFFNGVLKRNCEVEWCTPKVAARHSSSNAWNRSYWYNRFWSNRHPRSQYRRPFSIITIKPRLWKTPTSRIHDYLQTLLHEMLHSLLQMHTYDIASQSGHSIEWQEIAYMFELTARADLGLVLDLGREAAMATEVMALGNLPNDIELRRLSLDIKDIWENIHYQRELASENPPEDIQRSIRLHRLNHCIRSHWVADVI